MAFQMYYFLIVKSGKIWTLDSGTWNHPLALMSYNQAKQEHGANNVKLCTSPSDDDTVISRILKEYNRYNA